MPVGQSMRTPSGGHCNERQSRIDVIQVFATLKFVYRADDFPIASTFVLLPWRSHRRRWLCGDRRFQNDLSLLAMYKLATRSDHWDIRVSRLGSRRARNWAQESTRVLASTEALRRFCDTNEMGCLVHIRPKEFVLWWHDLDVYTLRRSTDWIATVPRIEVSAVCNELRQSIDSLYECHAQ